MEPQKQQAAPKDGLRLAEQQRLDLVRSDHLMKTRPVPVIDFRPSIDLGNADSIGLYEKRFPAIGGFVLARSELPYHSDDLDCSTGENHHGTKAAFVWFEIDDLLEGLARCFFYQVENIAFTIPGKFPLDDPRTFLGIVFVPRCTVRRLHVLGITTFQPA